MESKGSPFFFFRSSCGNSYDFNVHLRRCRRIHRFGTEEGDEDAAVWGPQAEIRWFSKRFSGWWFQIFFISIPTWGNDSI